MATNVRDTMVYGPLRDQSIQYKNKLYVADMVFPQLVVSPRSKILLYDRGPWFRNEASVRGTGAAAVRGNFTYTTTNIATTNYAFAVEIPDEDRRDAEYLNSVPLQPEMDAVDYATNAIELRREINASAVAVAATAVWSGETAGEDVNGLWAAGAGNTFIEDILAGIETIQNNTGIRPNRLLLTANTMAELAQETTLLARIQYSALGIVTPDLIAALFGLDKVIISDQLMNTADEGTTDSMTSQYIWEQTASKGSAFLYYFGPVGLKSINSGYICSLSQNGGTRQVSRWRDDARHSDVIEVAEEFDVKQIAPYTAKLYRDTILT